MDIEQLMTDRHTKFLAALATGFRSEAETIAWREANRAYVLARDAQTAPKRSILDRQANRREGTRVRVERLRQRKMEAISESRQTYTS